MNDVTFLPRTDTIGVLRMIDKYSRLEVGKDTIHPGIRGAINGILGSIAKHYESTRHEGFYRLFPGKWSSIEAMTTKDFSDAEWVAIWRWVKPYKDDGPLGDNKWKGHPCLVLEIENLLAFPNEVYSPMKAAKMA